LLKSWISAIIEIENKHYNKLRIYAMFSLLKLVIWIVGLVVVVYFALPHFGYEVNLNYFDESKEKCQARINDCTKELIQQGTKNAQCDFNCVDPQLIFKKK